MSDNRAIAQTKMTISQRARVHDVLIDVICTGRFLRFRSEATELDAFWLLGLGGVGAAALSMLGLAARGRPQITA